jgi:hypothetical protein
MLKLDLVDGVNGGVTVPEWWSYCAGILGEPMVMIPMIL